MKQHMPSIAPTNAIGSDVEAEEAALLLADDDAVEPSKGAETAEKAAITTSI